MVTGHAWKYQMGYEKRGARFRQTVYSVNNFDCFRPSSYLVLQSMSLHVRLFVAVAVCEISNLVSRRSCRRLQQHL